MVFKPWTDTRTPRHLLADVEEDFSTPQPLPTITTENKDTLAALSGTLLVIPTTLKFIPETLERCLPTNVTVSELIIKKKFIKRVDPDEFIEDEQLYSTEGDEVHEEVISYKLSVVKYTDDLSICMVQNFENAEKINYTLIATEILTHVTAEIVTITPGTVPFDQLICTLAQKWETEYLGLVPPFVITGIAGALVSQSKLIGRDVSALVLQSEGVPGFEKVNEYSIEELAQLLNKRFSLGQDFLKTLNLVVHSGKSVNNLGLYL